LAWQCPVTFAGCAEGLLLTAGLRRGLVLFLPVLFTIFALDCLIVESIMSEVANQQQLDDREFERLEKFLDGIGPSAMNIEELDGFFAALVCSPKRMPMSQCFPKVWGEDFAFSNRDEASELLALLTRHWNMIAVTLARTLHTPDCYLPVLLEDEDGVAHGNDWARGFMRGVSVNPPGWQVLIDDEEEGGAILPMMILAHEDDPDPKLRSPAIDGQSREDLVQQMIVGLTRIYAYFAPQRQSAAGVELGQAPGTVRREGAKIGRNEPCSCGSGKKFKSCCGAGPQRLH
jgi:uncharacterized protein